MGRKKGKIKQRQYIYHEIYIKNWSVYKIVGKDTISFVAEFSSEEDAKVFIKAKGGYIPKQMKERGR